MTSAADRVRSARARRLALAGVGITLLAATFFFRPTADDGTWAFRGPTMGTTYSVKVVAPGLSPAARARLHGAIRSELAQVNALMSTYDPESELSRFNVFESAQPFGVSADTVAVLSAAREVSELTRGAFDVTVAPLVRAWGFGATEVAPGEPSAADLDRLRAIVGYRLLEIDPASARLSKTVPATTCDLSAIAKGWAVDQVAELLLERGHADFFVEIGGDLRAHGRRHDGRSWRAGIERPRVGKRSVFRVVELQDLAMATSGDYRNYYEKNGKRFSHIIDPRSGRPVSHRLASVTVLHADAMRADALATGLAVLGARAGAELAEREKLAAYFIEYRSGGGFLSTATPAFAALAGKGAATTADAGTGGEEE
jgi:thiamine biosynthesis lipoprotein